MFGSIRMSVAAELDCYAQLCISVIARFDQHATVDFAVPRQLKISAAAI